MVPKFLCALVLSSEKPDQLAAFYRDVLGLPLEKREGLANEFSCMLGDTHFAVHQLQKGRNPTRGVEIGLHFSDLDALVKRLESKKVPIIEPIREYPWARSAEIRDPEGNVIYLMQVPQASLAQINSRKKEY